MLGGAEIAENLGDPAVAGRIEEQELAWSAGWPTRCSAGDFGWCCQLLQHQHSCLEEREPVAVVPAPRCIQRVSESVADAFLGRLESRKCCSGLGKLSLHAARVGGVAQLRRHSVEVADQIRVLHEQRLPLLLVERCEPLGHRLRARFLSVALRRVEQRFEVERTLLTRRHPRVQEALPRILGHRAKERPSGAEQLRHIGVLGRAYPATTEASRVIVRKPGLDCPPTGVGQLLFSAVDGARRSCYISLRTSQQEVGQPGQGGAQWPEWQAGQGWDDCPQRRGAHLGQAVLDSTQPGLARQKSRLRVPPVPEGPIRVRLIAPDADGVRLQHICDNAVVLPHGDQLLVQLAEFAAVGVARQADPVE